jgi:colanic acid biosynthesis glycosyl transferase WcaI
LRQAFFGVYRRSDAVVVLSRDMRELLVNCGVPSRRIQVIPNWIDTELVKPHKHENSFRAQHGLDDKFVVMYSGNLGMSQNLMQVLEAAQLLQEQSDIAFVFIGDGVDRPGLEKFASERKMTNVRFFNYQPKSSLATSLSAANLHLVVLRQNIRQFLMPSKIYGALASGTPILALASEDCELAEIVQENDVGRILAGETPRELADAVLAMARNSELLARQAINARAFAVARCTRDSSVIQVRTLLDDVLRRRRVRPTETESPERVSHVQ